MGKKTHKLNSSVNTNANAQEKRRKRLLEHHVYSLKIKLHKIIRSIIVKTRVDLLQFLKSDYFIWVCQVSACNFLTFSESYPF